jgi:hypothetical protein
MMKFIRQNAGLKAEKHKGKLLFFKKRLMPFRNDKYFPRSRKTKILTGGILEVCRGLKSESDTEIGKKSHFWRALTI